MSKRPIIQQQQGIVGLILLAIIVLGIVAMIAVRSYQISQTKSQNTTVNSEK